MLMQACPCKTMAPKSIAFHLNLRIATRLLESGADICVSHAAWQSSLQQ